MPQRPKVSARRSTDGSGRPSAQLSVADDGPGIAAAERERVFDRFYRRAGNAESGSGLGLAIAREIAARHGASITLQSSNSLGGLSARISFDPTGSAGYLDKSLRRVA